MVVKTNRVKVKSKSILNVPYVQIRQEFEIALLPRPSAVHLLYRNQEVHS